jgi:glycosyltransferase involved in cell wall biosynthesis
MTGLDNLNAPYLALFLPSLEGGGAEHVMMDLARGFVGRGFQVDLVLASAQGAFLTQVPTGVRVIDLKARRTLTALLPLVGYLRRVRPTALLATLDHANLIALIAKALAGTRTRTAIREANIPSRETTRSRKERLLLRLMRYLYPRADALIAVSQGVADDLVTTLGLNPSRVQVIYNPVVTDQLLQQAHEPLIHPWFAKGQPPVILGAGRLVLQKDFATLIRAFAGVRRQAHVRLVILGEGELRSELEMLVRELGLEGDVALPGFVDNPFPYMARAAVFVLSSAWEGLPNVLIQAMALGTPVVSTDCPSGPREILKGGEYGKLVAVGDDRALAEAIRVALELPRYNLTTDWVKPFREPFVTTQYLHALGFDSTQEG